MSGLYLLFSAGGNRFAMGTGEIVEVLPAVVWTSVPQAPPGVAGVFTYRGRHVPLIDLSQLTAGKPADIRMSTRIVLIRHSKSDRLLGLLAERVTETFRASENDFTESGISTAAAPYLGRTIQRTEGILQHLDINRLLESKFTEGALALDRNSHV